MHLVYHAPDYVQLLFEDPDKHAAKILRGVLLCRETGHIFPIGCMLSMVSMQGPIQKVFASWGGGGGVGGWGNFNIFIRWGGY